MKTRKPQKALARVKHQLRKPRIAIIQSRFNPVVTDGLLKGAQGYLSQQGIPFDESTQLFHAPGAFEMPLLAQALARSKKFDAVVCLGCVIKGDTAHFEFISLGSAVGVQQAALSTGVPITFGVLTTYTQEQAEVRSLADSHNKGIEAAAAAVEAWVELSRISVQSRLKS
ncbi:MAG: 6,7-dimethyl-8-ribityllumazine synthase [Oligoflexia bacterium]|jgi:6,7-dimethyl-8-ribityllumazine synthase